MGPAITFLTLLVLFFAGMAQSGSMPPKIAYSIAGVLAVITFGLAIARYKNDTRNK